MGFDLETSISAVTVFLQGLLSFFSPCVLPLIPLYIGYLSGGARTVDEEGNTHYQRGKVLLNTLFFVIGISFAFLALGLGVTAAGKFFGENRLLFTRIGGIIVILFGLYQLGLFGSSKVLSTERRLPFRLNRFAMGPLVALLLGFTFSFAWTPCVGPALASVLLMASSAQAWKGFLLIGVYTLGFVLPFLAVGFFTGTLLELFRKYKNVVKYTVKIGGILMVFMGVMMVTGWMNHISGYLSTFGAAPSSSQTTSSSSQAEGSADPSSQPEKSEASENSAVSSDASKTESSESASESSAENESAASSSESAEEESSRPIIPAFDFTLTDQNGETHTLSDYKGKTVFLNFWATWCPPCKAEMPHIQELYEAYGENQEDVIFLGVAAPNQGREGDTASITAFLEENGYTFPTVMDETGETSISYMVSALPTTFMIDKNGNIYGYASGQLSKEIMEQIITETVESVE